MTHMILLECIIANSVICCSMAFHLHARRRHSLWAFEHQLKNWSRIEECCVKGLTTGFSGADLAGPGVPHLWHLGESRIVVPVISSDPKYPSCQRGLMSRGIAQLEYHSTKFIKTQASSSFSYIFRKVSLLKGSIVHFQIALLGWACDVRCDYKLVILPCRRIRIWCYTEN